MIRLNIQKITLNYTAINKIKEQTLHPSILTLLKSHGRIIIQKAKPQMPYSSSMLRETHSVYKKYNNLPHLRDRYNLQQETKSSFKLDGEKLPTWNVRIAPNKIPRGNKSLTVYTYVMSAGKINGTAIRYSNINAKPYYIENAYKSQLKQMILDFENVLRRIISYEFSDNE